MKRRALQRRMDLADDGREHGPYGGDKSGKVPPRPPIDRSIALPTLAAARALSRQYAFNEWAYPMEGVGFP